MYNLGERFVLRRPLTEMTPLDELVPLGALEVDSPPPALPAPSVSLRVGVVAAFVAALGVFAFFAWRARLFAPYADDHDWMALALQQGGKLTVGYLMQPHNRQQIVWARLLAWMSRDGGEPSIFLAAGLTAILVAAVSSAVFAALLAPSRDVGVVLGALAGIIVADGAAVQDAAWAVFSVYAFVAAFTVLSLGLIECRKQERWADPFLLASLACALCAGFGNAAGYAVWPVLAWRAWRDPDRKAILPIVAVVAAAAMLSGFEGAITGQGAVAPSGAGAHVAKMIAYFGPYCALPLSGGKPKVVMEVMGWLLAGAGLLFLLKPPRTRGFERLGHYGRSLIAFALITAVMATIGRVDELPLPIVPTRYVVFADGLHVGLLLAAAPWLVSLWAARPRLAEAAILLFSVLLLAEQAITGAITVRSADMVRQASVAFDRGDRSAHTVSLVYPLGPATAQRVRRLMREAANAAADPAPISGGR
jgi:hypothetical protein